MKGLIFVLCLALIGCPNMKQSPTPNQESKVLAPEQNHPTEDEMAEQQLAIKEQSAYEKSVDQINQKMASEYSEYQTCLSNAKKKKQKAICQDMLERFCLVDALLDTREGYHYKPYCKILNK